MIPTLDSMLGDILRREGSEYTDHPADRGGPTRYGITLDALRQWRKRPTTADDVRELSEPEARAIYQSRYLSEPGLQKIHDPYVLSLAFDCAVNHGPARTIRWLQQCAEVTDDGVFGDATEVAVNMAEPVRLYSALLATRIRFYGRLVAHDPELLRATAAGYRLQATFASGWLNRATEFLEHL